uniref:G-protein coupled receptors family 1 profile domain-containing protein n=1 Tax=Acrobeloides nanus TaxID=290746 RepID=A0A914DA65_9BILA
MTCKVPEMQEFLMAWRFAIVAIVGGCIALFGVVANAAVAKLCVTSTHYRHSPFFFLGFVAVFDSLLDLVYILLLTTPILAEYFDWSYLYYTWIHHVQPLYMLGHIFKIASVFCLIVASFERYMTTRHWTFSGFEYSTKWIVLCLVIFLAVLIKVFTSIDIVVVLRTECDNYFQRYTVGGHLSRQTWFSGFLNLLTIFLPFFTLVFLNGGIVLMLRQQNIQQLRSLITELTMGQEVMKERKRSLREATNTLIVIISVYLVSNLLNLFLSTVEYVSPELLQKEHIFGYRIASDCASLLTVCGNALRCPAYLITNKNFRNNFRLMFFKEEPKVTVRRLSEKVENPWFSVLLTSSNKAFSKEEENVANGSLKTADPLLVVFDKNNLRRLSNIGIC